MFGRELYVCGSCVGGLLSAPVRRLGATGVCLECTRDKKKAQREKCAFRGIVENEDTHDEQSYAKITEFLGSDIVAVATFFILWTVLG